MRRVSGPAAVARAVASRLRPGGGTPDPTVPSFVRKRAELRRVRRIGHELGRRDPVFDVNGKLEAGAWARRLGVAHAAVLAHVPSPQDVPWRTLPQRFVVKPVRGAGSRGVFLLQREGDRLRELRERRLMTPDDVTTALDALAAEGRVSAELLVEELVEDPRRPGAAPADWKFATFFGRVGLVQAKVSGAGGTAGWKVFDERWRDLGGCLVGDYDPDPSIEPPAHAEALLETARLVSAAVPRPFVRVDLYDGEHGPVFGEITPEPFGPPGFRPDVDRLLGECWEEAEARLMVRSATAGTISPADSPLPESALRLHRRPSPA